MLAMPSTRTASAVDPAAPHAIRVLLVEDSTEAATLTRAQVTGGRRDVFHVEWHDNLKNAMMRLGKPDIDVILLDLGMPEMTGHKTHLAITSVVGKTVPVVILTSDERAISRNLSIAQGAASYLVKRQTTAFELRQALHEAVVLSKKLTARSLA